jgi:hypothetical protein
MIISYKSNEQIQYEKDLQKYKAIPFIFRIFFKKPRKPIPSHHEIMCRCIID